MESSQTGFDPLHSGEKLQIASPKKVLERHQEINQGGSDSAAEVSGCSSSSPIWPVADRRKRPFLVPHFGLRGGRKSDIKSRKWPASRRPRPHLEGATTGRPGFESFLTYAIKVTVSVLYWYEKLSTLLASALLSTAVGITKRISGKGGSPQGEPPPSKKEKRKEETFSMPRKMRWVRASSGAQQWDIR